ncbi:hypothetical protein AUC71_03165 [Methyloceanibacter marginalis]|uniref:Disulfide bond formation protein B n=1 Tax=Methyloceanibacter marginalis TaxID=1774971 RepID=A0A1E3W6Z2_9HYPH|nr:hypothetical protein AUC71_03165 [Methyloceanibacter marginalis]
MAMDKDRLAGQLMAVSAVLFGLALLTILTAHAFEQFGGYAPCPLCLQERYAYYFAVPAALVAFFAARGETFGFARLVLRLIAIGFLLTPRSASITQAPSGSSGPVRRPAPAGSI